MNEGRNGPYLQVAVICEKTLEEKNGVISIIRIIDNVTVTYAELDAHGHMPEIPINYALVVSFKSGEFKGKKELRIVLQGPGDQGKKGKDIFSLPINFEGDEKGTNVIMNNVMQTKTEGIYWFEIFLDDNCYTRVPLRVNFQPEKSAESGSPK